MTPRWPNILKQVAIVLVITGGLVTAAALNWFVTLIVVSYIMAIALGWWANEWICSWMINRQIQRWLAKAEAEHLDNLNDTA